MAKKMPGPGTILWTDLTIADAEGIRDFYSSVVGWQPEPVSQGEYDDYNMMPPSSDQPAAGICHARGVNTDIPPQWLVYITVEDLQAAMAAVEANGGKVLVPPGDGQSTCVIQDPAGAVCALYQPQPEHFA